MSKIYTTLHPQNDESVEIYPNVESQNIPNGAITGEKIADSSVNEDKLDTTLKNKINGKADANNVYTKTEVDNDLNLKADKSTTYTKTEVNEGLALRALKSDTYTKSETMNLLNGKADTSQVYTRNQTDQLLDYKADKSTTYTKTEVNGLLDGKQETLVSGSNIKTVNSQSLLGSGDISITSETPHITLSSAEEIAGSGTLSQERYDIIAGWNLSYIKSATGKIFVKSYRDGDNYRFSCIDNNGLIQTNSISIHEYKIVVNADKTWVLTELGNQVQEKLISGTNIKTVNGQSLLGNGNISLYRHHIKIINGDWKVSLIIISSNQTQYTFNTLLDFLATDYNSQDTAYPCFIRSYEDYGGIGGGLFRYYNTGSQTYAIGLIFVSKVDETEIFPYQTSYIYETDLPTIVDTVTQL